MAGTDSVALKDYFTTKISSLKYLLKVRDYSEDDTCIQQMEYLKTFVHEFRAKLALMKEDVEKRKSQTDQLKTTNNNLQALKRKLEYISNNIPERLPKPAGTTEPTVPEPDTSQATIKESTNSSVGPVSNLSVSTSSVPSSTSSSAKDGKKAENQYVPEIDFLTVEEFTQVPKYLKGRLSYDQVNKFIEAVNLSYTAKYKLLKKKKSTLNDANRKLYEGYKQQETKETAGCYFVIEQDIKLHGGLKFDKPTLSIIAILRHCGRIREIRGGKLTRFVYIDRY